VTSLDADPHRPGYHFLPPSNWINDPNGLLQWQGRYHLFYQYNPNGPFHGTIHWGHAVGDDLVHWEDWPVALAPSPGGPDKDGVYSGCGVDHDGVPTLIYTGIRPEVQCLATSRDGLRTWQKHEANPVVAAPPEGVDVEGFRDPFVWREADGWYCVVGSGIKGVGGTVFLYRSPDLVRWEYLHPLCTGALEETGRMWECPNFFPLGDKHVLLISPIPLGKVLYLVGTYADHRFTPEHVGVVDNGGHFYAPQVLLDRLGRRLMWGWLREGRGKEAQLAAGWSGALSVPTILSLGADGHLALQPAPELRRLRGAHAQASGVALVPGGAGVPGGLAGRRLEIAAVLEPGAASRVGLSVLRSPGGEEETRIVYDREAGELRVERERASLDPETAQDGRGVTLALDARGTLRLDVFVDGSIVEIFADERLRLTSRVYPKRPDSTGVRFFAEGGDAVLRAVDIWTLDSIWPASRPPL
jgi:beta-fructofuranosidase